MTDPETDAALRSIRALLAESSDDGEPYTPNPVLAERDVLAWEDLSEFALPEQYRVFLTQIGDGGRMPGSYCDFVVEPLAGVWGRWTASTPFPVDAARFRDVLTRGGAEGRLADVMLFPELEAHWEEADRPPGCLELGKDPTGDLFFLVTAGDLRGSVWSTVHSGVPAVDREGQPLGYLRWFADMLTEFARHHP
jgi:hypothetical protein